MEAYGLPKGSMGPVGLPKEARVVAARSLQAVQKWVVGANEDGYHYIHVDMARDLPEVTYHDLRMLNEGEKCPICGGTIKTARGIEVGQVFKLGTKYSEGCYGIGVSRTIAAAVEQHYDEKGLVWPKAMAPYHASLVIVNVKDEEQMDAGEVLYNRLQEAGFDILMDDRKERAGVKFNDADLIGLPVRITVGKKIGEGIVEYKLRTSDEVLELTMDEVIEKLTAFYNE